MRLWTLHPRYLDAKGLLALWREALLAQKVLRGKTRGYRNHPQLERFRGHPDPPAAIAAYLLAVHAEARARGYRFDGRKIGRRRTSGQLSATSGQLQYEWAHLLAKLRARAPEHYRRLKDTTRPEPHPLFRLVAGKIAKWERLHSSGETVHPRQSP